MEAREPQRPIAVVGWSLGAAVGLQVATRIGVERVVAMSPWTSLADIGREHFPGWLVGAFLRESYDSIGVAPRIDVPALVVHGELDTIIPVAQGRRVAAALPRSQLIEIEGYGHNDLLGSPRVWQELRRFLGD
jgi:pimeloyl-ACP methyl ester carboxylesterase